MFDSNESYNRRGGVYYCWCDEFDYFSSVLSLSAVNMHEKYSNIIEDDELEFFYDLMRNLSPNC